MKKNLQNYGASLFLVILVALSIFIVLTFAVPKAKPMMTTYKTNGGIKRKENKEVLSYVAIGDSLTEGVGDSTNSGGFVPLVAKEIKKEYKLNGIQTENYGKSGDRSDQILKKIKNSEEIQKSITSADIITITVGGNDLMKVVKGDLFKITTESFEKPLKNYQKEIEKIIQEIRKYNADVPIYFLGIYNPFYLYFPEITEMQSIVNNWNKATKEVVTNEKNTYFIPINDLLYKGKNNEVGIVGQETTSSSTDDKNVENELLYEADHFHPNNLGYQIMANAICEELIETKDSWLPKTEEE